jgi:hypothetical protein
MKRLNSRALFLSIISLALLVAPLAVVKALGSVKTEEVPYFGGKPTEKLFASDVSSGYSPIYHADKLYYIDINGATGNKALYEVSTVDASPVPALLADNVESLKTAYDPANNWYGIVYSKYTDGVTGFDVYMYNLQSSSSVTLCVLPGDQLSPTALYSASPNCDALYSERNGDSYVLKWSVQTGADTFDTRTVATGSASVFKTAHQSHSDIEYLEDNTFYTYDVDSRTSTQKVDNVQNFVATGSGLVGYYESAATGNGDIYSYNFNLGTTNRITTSSNKEFLPTLGFSYNESVSYLQSVNEDGTLTGGVRAVKPTLAGNTVVSSLYPSTLQDPTNNNLFSNQGLSFWTRVVDGKTNIYGFNTGSLDRISPRTVGGFTVWQDKRNGKYYDIFAYNKATGTTVKISSGTTGYSQTGIFQTDGHKYVLYTELVENANEGNYNNKCVTLYNLETGERTIVATDANVTSLGVGGDKVIYQQTVGANTVTKVYTISTLATVNFPYTSANFVTVSSSDGRYVSMREDVSASDTDNFTLYDLDESKLIMMKADVPSYNKMGGGQVRPQISGDKVFWYDATKVYVYTISTGKLVEVANILKDGYGISNMVVDGDTLVWDEFKFPESFGLKGGLMNTVASLFQIQPAYAASNSIINIFSLSAGKLLSTIGLNISTPLPNNLALANDTLAYGDIDANGVNTIYLASLSTTTTVAAPSTLPQTGIFMAAYYMIIAAGAVLFLNRKRIFRKKKVWER